MIRTPPFFLQDARYCRPPVFGLLSAEIQASNPRRVKFKLMLGEYEGGTFRERLGLRYDPFLSDHVREVQSILHHALRERIAFALREGWEVIDDTGALLLPPAAEEILIEIAVTEPVLGEELIPTLVEDAAATVNGYVYRSDGANGDTVLDWPRPLDNGKPTRRTRELHVVN